MNRPLINDCAADAKTGFRFIYDKFYVGSADHKAEQTLAENMELVIDGMIAVAGRIGTHTPKLRNQRVSADQIAPFIVEPPAGDCAVYKYLGGTGRYAKFGHMLVEPVRLLDETHANSLFERFLTGRAEDDPLIQYLRTFIEDGDDRMELLLAEIRSVHSALDDPSRKRVFHSTENFAVIFCPDDNLESISITPVQSHDSFDLVQRLTQTKNPETGETYLPYSHTLPQRVAKKKDNISLWTGVRHRLKAFVPDPLSPFEASVYRYLKQDYDFPPVFSSTFERILTQAAKKYEKTAIRGASSNANILRSQALNNSRLIKIAQVHIGRVQATSKECFNTEIDLNRIPSAFDLVRTHKVRDETLGPLVRNFQNSLRAGGSR